MTKVDKEEVLKILYECITNPEIDEDDEALVDYRQAKTPKTKKPTGLSIKRDGRKFTFEWKIGDAERGRKKQWIGMNFLTGQWTRSLSSCPRI
jgi:hypothetical protein